MLNAALVESHREQCQGARVENLKAFERFRGCGAAVLLALAATACTNGNKPQVIAGVASAAESKGDIWRRVATDADKDRLARLSTAWAQGLADAREHSRKDVLAEGALLKSNGALPRPAPTPGSYNCRLLRLGAKTKKTPGLEKFKPFFCYVEVEGDLLTIVKQTGSQRPAGRLWEDDNPDRMIFLGSLALGDEEQPLAYGDDPRRDMAGVFERVGPFRWRLVIPWPQGPSKLDVFELTPVADQPE
jgi:hypothetical protein